MAARRLGARLDAAADTTGWLPEANRPRGKAFRGRSTVSPAWIRGMRARAARAVLIGFACSLVFAGGVWWTGELYDSADQLLRDGTRVPGEVTAVWGSKGDSFVRIYCVVGDVPVDHTFVRDSDVSYVVGQAVTVVYDPADPTRIRTIKEKNIGEGGRLGVAATVLAGLVGITWSAILAVGWISRCRRTRTTGWREAIAVQIQGRDPRSRVLLAIGFTDSSSIVLRPTASSLRSASRATSGRPVTALVSGTGRAMTVLVPREGRRPWLIAVKAQGLRAR